MASKDSTWQKLTVKPWILLAFLVACEQGGGKGTNGAELYQSLCATCHGPKGKPSEVMVARLAVKDLTSQELRARITPALVEAQVRTGSKNKLMPSFTGAMSDDQIKAVAAYVSSAEFLAK